LKRNFFKKWISALAIVGLLQTSPLALANGGDDTLAQATNIDVNQTYSGYLSDYYDVEYYGFSLSSTGKLDITISNVSNTSWMYQLYDNNGNAFDWYGYTDYSELASGNSMSSIGLPAGDYYLKVSRYTGKVEDTPYSIRLGFTAGSTFEQESNNTLSTASPIALNENYQSHLQHRDDIDFYKFNLSKNGKLSISLPNVSNKSWKYHLYDSQGNEYPWYSYTDYNELAKGNSVTSIGLPAGDYFLRVSRYTGEVAGEPYTLQLKFVIGDTFEREKNDTLSTATPVAVNKIYDTGLQYNDDIDFYKFNLPKSGKLSIIIPNVSGKSWMYRLYDSNGKEFPWYNNTTYDELAKGNSVTSIGLPAGDYYVRVSRYTGNVGNVPYSVQFKFTAGDTYEKENNDTLSVATPITVNKLYEAELITRDDNDYYRFTLSSSSIVNLGTIKNNKDTYLYSYVTDNNGKSYDIGSGKVKLSAGTYYVRMSGGATGYKLKINAATPTLEAKQVKVTNKKGKTNDSLTVTSLKKGDIVKVYNSQGKLLTQATSSGTKNSLMLTHLSTSGGTLSVSVTSTGLQESGKLSVKYGKE